MEERDRANDSNTKQEDELRLLRVKVEEGERELQQARDQMVTMREEAESKLKGK